MLRQITHRSYREQLPRISTATLLLGVPGRLVGVQGQWILERETEGVPVRARDLVREFPLVNVEMSANAAVRLLAEQSLPGLIVVDDRGNPHAVLASTSVLRLVLPTSIQESAATAHTIDEASAEKYLTEAGTRTVRECLPAQTHELPVVGPSATVLEIAALMVRTHCPLVAVVDQERGVLGSVTLHALSDRMFAS